MELGNEPLVFRSAGSRSPRTAADIAMSYTGSIVMRRWAATWIDFLVLGSILMVPDGVFGNAFYQRTIAIWLSLFVLYIPLCEWLSGKTLGKLLLFIRVVDAQGNNPSVVQTLARTVLRLIEVNPLLMGGIPAGIAALVSKHHQRLGDMVANTYVLRDSDVRELRSRPRV